MVAGNLRRWPTLLAGGCLLLTAAAVVLLVVGLAADEEPDLPGRAIPVPTVLDEPQRFVGREITVTGQVDVLTDRALSLGDRDLIVVATGRPAPKLQTAGFGVGDVVYATGELRVLSADEVVELLPGTSILPTLFQDFERQPVLLADAVIPGS